MNETTEKPQESQTPRIIAFGLIIVLFFLSPWILGGCSMSPIRVFQAKVPAPIVKSEKQIEGERQAADVLVRGLAGVKRIEDLAMWLEVARKLSASLGPPQKPISIDVAKPEIAATRATDGLEAGLASMQKQIAAQNVILAKYAGKEIEGTGLSLLGPGMTVVVIAIVAVAVLCPGALTLALFALKRLRKTGGMVVEQIEQAAQDPETKDAVAKIKKNLSSVMDHLPTKEGDLHRAIIDDLKTA